LGNNFKGIVTVDDFFQLTGDSNAVIHNQNTFHAMPPVLIGSPERLAENYKKT
jgi:hypothetical protein